MRNVSTAASRLVLAGLLAGTLGAGCASSGTSGPRQVDLHKARTHYDLASSHLAAGRTALAIREFRAANQLDPGDAWIHQGLAEAYRRRGHLEDAEQHLQSALEIQPQFHEALLNLSALYLQMERYAESAELSRRLGEDPTFPAPWRALTNLGWARYKLGQNDEARRALKLAADYHPGYWPAQLNLGILESEDGRLREAMELFERVLEIGPGPSAAAEANYRMAEIYVRLGKRDEAVHHLLAATEGGPRSRWVKEAKRYLELLQ